eukprot:GHVQ01038595.1.p1 GENE.GHVQ01038595.1~~GHVQ01038595.1.p1  ORF type:complete len:403 (+),score=57.26 GHVQ01038595.1:3-1211(+)
MNLKHEVLINVMAKQEALNRRRNECNDVEANHGREEAESLAGAPPREEDERKRKPREARGSFSTPSSTPGMPRPTHSARWSSALMSCADVADPSALTSPPNSDDGSGRENLPHKDLIDAVNRVMWQRSQMESGQRKHVRSSQKGTRLGSTRQGHGEESRLIILSPPSPNEGIAQNDKQQPPIAVPQRFDRIREDRDYEVMKAEILQKVREDHAADKLLALTKQQEDVNRREMEVKLLSMQNSILRTVPPGLMELRRPPTAFPLLGHVRVPESPAVISPPSSNQETGRRADARKLPDDVPQEIARQVELALRRKEDEEKWRRTQEELTNFKNNREADKKQIEEAKRLAEESKREVEAILQKKEEPTLIVEAILQKKLSVFTEGTVCCLAAAYLELLGAFLCWL